MKVAHDESRVIQFRKDFRANLLPKWYNGIAHIAFNSVFLIGSFLFFLSKVHNLKGLEWLVVPVTLVIGNLAVYLIHRYPLHHHYPLVGHHTYRIHSKLHHQFFTHEYSRIDQLDDFYLLFFPPWTIVLFLAVHCPITYVLIQSLLSANCAYLYLAMSTFYFILYEVFHFVSHLPAGHWLLRVKHFARMREHHTVHHDPKLMHRYNFNVVFPLFDSIFRTTYFKHDSK